MERERGGGKPRMEEGMLVGISADEAQSRMKTTR